MKVLSVFGTRPEAIKMAPVVLALAEKPGIVSRVCVTAQHREMLDQVTDLFGIKPDYDLDLMRPRQTLAGITASVLTDITPVLEQEQPDWVLVQGDTTTVMATALAAFYLGIRVGHVEAGLRTRDKRQPFPEEINRRIAGVIADLHFAPTQLAADNLLAEKISLEQIIVTGNTVIDALQRVALMPYDMSSGPLAGIPFEGHRIIALTSHRRENHGTPREAVCQAVLELVRRYPDVHIVYPVHPSPAVCDTVYPMLSGQKGITLLEPLDYQANIQLMRRSYLVITDSGGMQEEAPGLGVPVLVLREKTERPEGVRAGVVRLVGTSKERILAEAARLLDDANAYKAMAQAVNPYGDGRAAERIVNCLAAWGAKDLDSNSDM